MFSQILPAMFHSVFMQHDWNCLWPSRLDLCFRVQCLKRNWFLAFLHQSFQRMSGAFTLKLLAHCQLLKIEALHVLVRVCGLPGAEHLAQLSLLRFFLLTALIDLQEVWRLYEPDSLRPVRERWAQLTSDMRSICGEHLCWQPNRVYIP